MCFAAIWPIKKNKKNKKAGQILRYHLEKIFKNFDHPRRTWNYDVTNWRGRRFQKLSPTLKRPQYLLQRLRGEGR